MATKTPDVLETAFGLYTLGAVLGEGGAGRVFNAVDTTGTEYAVKLLHPDRLTTERRKRFQNEIAFCQRTKHPNILPVVDHGIVRLGNTSTPFYVMPRFEGSLRKRMRTGIPSSAVLGIFSQLLDGVEAAHLQGVIHRDLKPENILVKGATMAVADFGIAHFREEELYTAVETAGAKLANLEYAAPEQRSRGRPVSQTADIFALGLILNELLTGHVPAGTDYPLIGQVHPDLAYLDDLVAGMIKHAPEGRPPTIDALKQDLIGRRKEFVTRQQLLVASNQVVPSSEVRDPLIDNPVRIMDFEWSAGALTLVLSQSVPPEWIEAFRNIGSRTAEWGADVTDFIFRGNRASVRADSAQVQAIINHFKSWIPRATQEYERRVKRAKAEAEEQERQRLQAERRELEQQLALRRQIQL